MITTRRHIPETRYLFHFHFSWQSGSNTIEDYSINIGTPRRWGSISEMETRWIVRFRIVSNCVSVNPFTYLLLY
jgi:hypothetical protein